jgi:hypothetical protein
MSKARFLLSVLVGLVLGALATGILVAQNGSVGQERDKATGWVAGQGEYTGLELYILLDDGSKTSSLGSQLGDIRQFILGQPSSTKIGVAYMRNGIALIAQNLTSDHQLAAKALRLPMGLNGGNGSPYFSLAELVKHWPKSDSRREVLMISDGIDRYYEGTDTLDPYLAEAIEKAQRAGVVVSAIYNPGVGDFGQGEWRRFIGQTYLAQMTQETGGQAYYIGFNGPAVSFAPYLRDFANRLNHADDRGVERRAGGGG